MGCGVSKTTGNAIANTAGKAIKNQEGVEKLTVEVETGLDNKGINEIVIELVIYHSATNSPDAVVDETCTTAINTFTYSRYTKLGKSKGHHTFRVTANEEIRDCVFAIKLRNAVTKEWFFEAVTLKRERDGHSSKGYYFPIFSHIVTGTHRVFFCGAHTPSDKSIPPKILKLREEDLAFWRQKYTPRFLEAGLPVGLVDKTDDLVHEEKFSEEKQGNFEYHGEKSLAARGIVKLLSFGVQMFKSFSEIDKLLYILEKKPQIAYHWREDAVFGAQIVSGVNPVLVRALPGSVSLPLSYLPDVSVEKLSKVPYLAGKEVEEELKQGRFSYIDFEPLLGPFVDRINSDCAQVGEDKGKHKFNGFIASPVALFYNDVENGKIYPVAIRVLNDGDTFYPPAADNKDANLANQWLLAKMWFGLGDSNVHQLSTHLLRTHLCIETFDIAMARQLSPNHPIYKLLKHHFRCTMAINAAARERLIKTVSLIFSIGDCSFDFLKHAYSMWNFLDSSPLKDLQKRGFGRNESSLDQPGQYPWAEDSRDLWHVYTTFVKEYVDIYYESDADVASDSELQNWIQEADEYNGANKGIPKKLETKDTLQEVVSILIWTTTAQHSSVNFSQYTYTSYSPNRPSKSHKPPIKNASDVVDDTYLLHSLPTIAESARVSGIVATLSSYEPHEVMIGHRCYDLHGASEVKEKEVFKKFGVALKDYEKRIDDRNAKLAGRKENPYIWLKPSKITNSIAI